MRTNTNNIYRDKIMSDITEQDVGSNLKIAGWVENIRDHGGVSFIDLRDMYGVMQVVMRDTSLLDGINKEDCISVEGEIEHRDEETYNPKIPTGTIELEAHHVDILGKVYRQLPFEIATSKETREDVRLKYRYLDLRNIKVRDNMIFRSKVISYLREKMTEMGFLEIQTPILCASSPTTTSFFAASCQINTKFREIITFANILSIGANCYCRQTCTLRPIVHNFFEFNHIAKILNPHCHTPPVLYTVTYIIVYIVAYICKIVNPKQPLFLCITFALCADQILILKIIDLHRSFDLR